MTATYIISGNNIDTKLRNLRADIAKQEGIAPYSVFDDEELTELLKASPKSLQELAKIKGFPAKGARVTKWGKYIVEAFGLNTGNTKVSSFGKK